MLQAGSWGLLFRAGCVYVSSLTRVHVFTCHEMLVLSTVSNVDSVFFCQERWNPGDSAAVNAARWV